MENIKKSVISGEFIIEIDKTGHVSVYRIYNNVMGSIREIYEKENLEYDPNWTQRQIGYNLIKKYCTEEDKTQAIIGEYLIHRRENGSIETFREYGKGNVIGALREVAKTVGFEVDLNWTTQQLGNKLVDFINNKPQITYVMKEININGRMTVSALKDDFRTQTGGTLRVKDGGRKADESATVASIRKESDNKSGAFALNPEMTVGDFKAKMLSDYGLKVEVGTPDDWVSVPDGITLGQLRELPKNATKKQLNVLLNSSEDDSERTDENEGDGDNEEVSSLNAQLPFSGEYKDGKPIVKVNFIDADDLEDKEEAKGGIVVVSTKPGDAYDDESPSGMWNYVKVLDEEESLEDWIDNVGSDDGTQAIGTIMDYLYFAGSYRVHYSSVDGATYQQKIMLASFLLHRLKVEQIFCQYITPDRKYDGPEAVIQIYYNGEFDEEFLTW